MSTLFSLSRHQFLGTLNKNVSLIWYVRDYEIDALFVIIMKGNKIDGMEAFE